MYLSRIMYLQNLTSEPKARTVKLHPRKGRLYCCGAYDTSSELGRKSENFLPRSIKRYSFYIFYILIINEKVLVLFIFLYIHNIFILFIYLIFCLYFQNYSQVSFISSIPKRESLVHFKLFLFKFVCIISKLKLLRGSTTFN